MIWAGRGHFSWPTSVSVLVGAGSIGFNIRWYRRDTRPVAVLKTIGDWKAREPYAGAEPGLRERPGASDFTSLSGGLREDEAPGAPESEGARTEPRLPKTSTAWVV
jgi:hypothetical protein